MQASGNVVRAFGPIVNKVEQPLQDKTLVDLLEIDNDSSAFNTDD